MPGSYLKTGGVRMGMGQRNTAGLPGRANSLLDA